jgi:4-amino-4-deoxy-L-arabinose transferase-like glycosyltransferase
MADDENVCHSCGAKWQERGTPSDVSLKQPASQALPVDRLKAELSVSPSKRRNGIMGRRLDKSSSIEGMAKRLDNIYAGRSKLLSGKGLNHSDLITLVVLLAILALKVWLAVGKPYQGWDGYVYLLNARSFATGSLALPNYFEVLRPPLYPFIIAEIWQGLGENIVLAEAVSPIFTVASAWLLYLLLKEMFDARAGLIASVGFLLSPVVMFYTDQVLVHGLGVFFVALTAFSLWRARKEPMYYFIVGAGVSLASLTRYTDGLIAFAAIVFVLIDLKNSPQRRKRILTWVTLGSIVLVGLWLPWLSWCQNVYHDALISVKAGEVAGVGSTGGAWFFYLDGFPNFLVPYGTTLLTLFSSTATTLALPGLGLLILGLLSKGWLKDERRLLLAAWFLPFFAYYSSISNQNLRFMVEWAPPLFAIIGIGVSGFFGYLKTRRIRRHRILSVSISAIVGIWLILLLMGSFAAETQTLAADSYTPILGSVDGFQLSVSWLQQHMNQSEIGLTDIPPYFSYYTHRFFYYWDYLLQVAAARNITIKDAMTLLHIKYAVFRNYFVQVNNIKNLTFLVSVQEFNGYSIYRVSQ